MGGTLAGDDDIVAELSSIDPKVTESGENEGVSHAGKSWCCRIESHALLSMREGTGSGTT